MRKQHCKSGKTSEVNRAVNEIAQREKAANQGLGRREMRRLISGKRKAVTPEENTALILAS